MPIDLTALKLRLQIGEHVFQQRVWVRSNTHTFLASWRRQESSQARTRSKKLPLALVVGTPSRPRVLLFALPLWSPQLSSPLAARPLQGVPLIPCDPETEIGIFPAPSKASSDGSLQSS